MGSRKGRGGLGRRRAQAVGMDRRWGGSQVTRRRVTGVGHRDGRRMREEITTGERNAGTHKEINGAGRIRNKEGEPGGFTEKRERSPAYRELPLPLLSSNILFIVERLRTCHVLPVYLELASCTAAADTKHD
eukprot:scaffold125336_cov30-Tisochrysis_lutea.AAC.2